MTHYNIFLVEDRVDDAEKIVNSLTKLAREKNNNEYDFRFEPIVGRSEEEYEGKEYVFYDETVIEEIEEHLNIENIDPEDHDKQKAGLLLDILLTKEDIESNLSSYYPQPELAKKIYFRFYKRIPVYMITAFSAFAIQSDVIMGVDLSEQYIAKDALLRYEFKGDIDKLFNFYHKFYQEKGMQDDSKA